MEEVWRLPFDPSTNVVDVYVKYYREDLTMREVAEVIGVKQSRASQIHSMVLLKLRAAMVQGQVPPPSQREAPRTQVGR
jgi:hypothetical protein